MVGRFHLLAAILAIAASLATTEAVAGKKDLTSILQKTAIERGLSHSKRYGFQMVTGFARRGNKAQRFEIRHGDCGRSGGWNDCDTDRARVERKEAPKNAFSLSGKGVWYGLSVFIPADFVSLGKANTSLIQAKVEGDSMPIWQVVLNDRPYVVFSDSQNCSAGTLGSWRGQWNDLSIYVHYGTSGQKTYFQLFKNGRMVCERRNPVMNRSMWGKRQKIGLKYGIYNSFVSRYLAAKATKQVNLQAYSQNQSSGTTSRSPAQSPFKIDWGVKLPTHVIFFDEMLAGPQREQVDVRLRESAGLPPVD